MIKRFKQFINENDSTYINWEEIEKACANKPNLPDCIPTNIRQWDTFIKQYERACDLVNGKWEPHYDWETEEEFIQAVNEQFYFGKGYKNSIYEYYDDFIDLTDFDYLNLFKNVNRDSIGIAFKYITWDIYLDSLDLDKLPTPLPKKIGGDFECSGNKLITLEGAPDYVGRGFYCNYNYLTTLEGCSEYVGSNFSCNFNKLTTLKGSPKYVGNDFSCNNNNLISLEGAPNVDGNFYFANTKLPKTIPDRFPGKDLHKYIDL